MVKINKQKAEAVKWVKTFREHTKSGLPYKKEYDDYEFKDFYDWDKDDFSHIEEWIKDFFNLTEEDLKWRF